METIDKIITFFSKKYTCKECGGIRTKKYFTYTNILGMIDIGDWCIDCTLESCVRLYGEHYAVNRISANKLARIRDSFDRTTISEDAEENSRSLMTTINKELRTIPKDFICKSNLYER